MHVLHNILPVLSLQCLNVRICDKNCFTMPLFLCRMDIYIQTVTHWVCEITIRLSDMTENALYMHLHSTEVSLSLRTAGNKRR